MDEIFIVLTHFLSDHDRCSLASCDSELAKLNTAYFHKPHGLRVCMFCTAQTRSVLSYVGVGCCKQCFYKFKDRISDDFGLPAHTIVLTK